MTAFFLNTVKKEIVNSQKFKRVLDFCCGSGTIAYAYKNFIHTLKNDISISLLDADSVALEAAKKNVKDAKQYYLSDGWYSVDSDEQFDLILSNPPVHVGHHDCFDVVSNLIEVLSAIFLQAENYGLFVKTIFRWVAWLLQIYLHRHLRSPTEDFAHIDLWQRNAQVENEKFSWILQSQNPRAAERKKP